MFFAAARMSAFGTKQTYRSACYFVCFRGEANSQRSVFHDAIRYWRLARDNRFRPRAACNGRWRKDREIGVTADEPIEADLAIPNGSELASQETGRGAVLGRRREGVDNADARFRLEREDEIVEQGVRLLRSRDTCAPESQCRPNQLATSDREAHQG